MRIKTDENIHPGIAEYLTAAGHDAVTVWDEALQGTSDEKLISICRQEGRILFTLDLDFANIRAYPPSESAGIVVFRLASQSRQSVLRAVERLRPLLSSQVIDRRLWIVDEDRVRQHE